MGEEFLEDTYRNAMHVGETADSMRLRDVIEAAEVLRAEDGVDPERIVVVGRGPAGVMGLYAGVLGAAVEQVILITPPTSHVQGPYFLNVLRYTDLPEAAALFAPRRINFTPTCRVSSKRSGTFMRYTPSRSRDGDNEPAGSAAAPVGPPLCVRLVSG
jgi:hypothetical protein